MRVCSEMSRKGMPHSWRARRNCSPIVAAITDLRRAHVYGWCDAKGGKELNQSGAVDSRLTPISKRNSFSGRNIARGAKRCQTSVFASLCNQDQSSFP